MNYNDILLDEILENYQRITKYENIKNDLFLTVKKTNIFLNSRQGEKAFFFSPLASEITENHGNSIIKILNDFISVYNFENLLNLAIKKENEEIEKHNFIKNSLCKIENLKKKLSFCSDYLQRDFEIYNHLSELEFSLIKNNFQSYIVKVKPAYEEKEKFSVYVDNSRILLSENELIEKLQKYINEIAEPYKKELENKKELKRIEEEKEEKLHILLNQLSNDIVLYKLKNGYFVHKNNTRFSAGKGKQGKYINCNFYDLLKLIKEKDIQEYCIIDKDIKIMNYEKEDFKKLNFSKIYA